MGWMPHLPRALPVSPWEAQRGQGITEYAGILGLVVVVAAVLVTVFGQAVYDLWQQIVTSLPP